MLLLLKAVSPLCLLYGVISLFYVLPPGAEFRPVVVAELLRQLFLSPSTSGQLLLAKRPAFCPPFPAEVGPTASVTPVLVFAVDPFVSRHLPALAVPVLSVPKVPSCCGFLKFVLDSV